MSGVEVEGRKWFVTDRYFDNGGTVIAGPFSSFDDAIEARRAMERFTRQSFYIDHRDPKPPDPYTPGSVWYAKESFTTRKGHDVERGSRWVVSGLRLSGCFPDEVICNNSRGYLWYLPKAMLVAEPPEPLVVLPTGPTLGIATFRNGDVCTAVWNAQMRPVCIHGSSSGGDPEYVTAFTEAVAVPKDALDELRRIHDEDGDTTEKGMSSFEWWETVGDVLAAVDAAGEGK